MPTFATPVKSMIGEVSVVPMVLPPPQASESAMANLPAPPVRLARLDTFVHKQLGLPESWVTVHPVGGHAPSNPSLMPPESLHLTQGAWPSSTRAKFSLWPMADSTMARLPGR